jgi:hypothetical protein
MIAGLGFLDRMTINRVSARTSTSQQDTEKKPNSHSPHVVYHTILCFIVPSTTKGTANHTGVRGKGESFLSIFVIGDHPHQRLIFLTSLDVMGKDVRNSAILKPVMFLNGFPVHLLGRVMIQLVP